MKSAITGSLVLAIVILGFLAGAPMAYAQVTNHAGTFCTYSNTSEVTFVEHLMNGTSNHKTSAIKVICPLTRSTTKTSGAYVYVDVTHTGTQTITCQADSYDSQGRLIARAFTSPQAQTFSGFRELTLNLSGAGKSSAWSDYSVGCTIAGNSTATIHGVDLSE